MIDFNYQETAFKLDNEQALERWINSVISAENCKLGDVSYIFCNDTYLHKLNVEFLEHDTLTDIISFDYSVGKELHGDIFISIERVVDNARDFKVDFKNELYRVMVHGILHYCGYKDKNDADIIEMRAKENFYLEELV